MEILTRVRGFAYICGVLRSQESDQFCSSCNAFVNTLSAVRDSLAELETRNGSELKNLPAGFSLLYFNAKSGLAAIKQPENPQGQKKAGNCRLPEGVCFVKSAKALLQKV
jgi:hypothetical protein